VLYDVHAAHRIARWRRRRRRRQHLGLGDRPSRLGEAGDRDGEKEGGEDERAPTCGVLLVVASDGAVVVVVVIVVAVERLAQPPHRAKRVAAHLAHRLTGLGHGFASGFASRPRPWRVLGRV